MTIKVRSNGRSLLGLAVVSLAIAAIIAFAPSEPGPAQTWRPPAGYVVAETVPLDSSHTLRLWTSPSGGWYVESRTSGRYEAAVGAAASASGDYSASEILGGLVGHVPVAGTRAVSVGSPGATVRHGVHDGIFLVPASVVPARAEAVLVTPLDAAGGPLAEETAVPIDRG